MQLDFSERAVARSAHDLADSWIFERDEGYELTADATVDHHVDACDDYARFQLRRWRER